MYNRVLRLVANYLHLVPEHIIIHLLIFNQRSPQTLQIRKFQGPPGKSEDLVTVCIPGRQ